MADLAEITPEAERELLQRAQGGNEDAFGTLMKAHYEPVFRLVHSIIRDEHAARDVSQEIWLSVWKNIGKFRGDSKFSTWVHPIATRRAIDHLRSRKRWTARFLPFLGGGDESEVDGQRLTGAPEPVDTNDPRQDLERDESKLRFERAIASLPPKHRAVLALREINELSYDEIAEAVGINRGTVMSRLFHARRMLAQKLGEQS